MLTKRSVKKLDRGTTGSKSQAKTAVLERRVATPNPDLVLMRTGKLVEKAETTPREQASSVLARIAKVMKKPGANRAVIFSSTLGKPVFAYFLHPKDPTKVVREDVSGRKTVGRLVGGRFRSVDSASTD